VAGAGLFVMVSAQTHTQVVAAVTVNGLGVGLMIPLLLTWIMSLIDFDMRGRAAGGFTAAFFGGEFLSPLVVLAITGGAAEGLPVALGGLAAGHLFVAVGCLLLPVLGAFKRHADSQALNGEA